MIELTIKERKNLYQKAYEILEKEGNWYVCHIFEEITKISWEKFDKEILPEFYLFQEGTNGLAFLSHEDSDTIGYSWKEKDEVIKIRKLHVLALCIAMCD